MEQPDTLREEVSLIELAAVVIRHRRWVYATTTLGIILAFITLFLLPLFGIKLIGGTTFTLQSVVRTVAIPGDAQASVNFDIPSLALAQVGNLSLVGSVYRDTLMTDAQANLAKPAFNRLVKGFVSKSLKMTVDSKSQSLLIVLTVSEADQTAGTQFLTRLTTSIRDKVRGYTVPVIQAAVGNLGPGRASTGELGAQSQAQFEVRAKSLQSVLADPDFPLAQVGDIEAVEDDAALSRSGVAAILVAGALLLGILLAFAVEAVSKVRSSPESSELLRRAWKGE